MKTYDRDKVLSVAAQLLAGRAYDYGGRADHDPHKCAVRSAKRLIDEVERQCPLPGTPKPTPGPFDVKTVPLADSDRGNR